MKRFKRILFDIVAAALLAAFCLTLAGCEDIRKLELKIKVYNFTDNVYYAEEDVTMTIDLYRHLAPVTVDAIISYANEGYYDGCVFYKLNAYSNQIMVGDLKVVNGEVTPNAAKPMIEGEFENGGTIGSNLTCAKGAVGLWRTWNAHDNNYKTSANTDTGRATWFMPTSTISDYNKWFCVFAQIDLDNAANSTAFSAITAAFEDSLRYEERVVYYSGEYGEDGEDLVFHCVEPSDFHEEAADDYEKTDFFVAEGDQLVCYNNYRIRIPVVSNDLHEPAAYIVSARVK